VSVKHHDGNLGKGAAIRTGLEAITAPLVVIQDADLEYDPADYDKLIRQSCVAARTSLRR
jgi:glycosyltransferase involved in cell wall biosynthesis